MALWHCDFHLIPRRALIEHFGRVPDRMSNDLFSSVNWWRGLGISPGLLDQLDRRLPRMNSWSKDVLQWGTDDGNRVDAVVEHGELASLLVRIDARILDHEIVALAATLAEELDALVLTDQSELREPSLYRLLDAFENSRAARFVKAPDEFLDNDGRET